MCSGYTINVTRNMNNSFQSATYTQSERVRVPTQSGNLLLDFLFWYFVVAPKNIVKITGDFLVANINYFSMRLHFRTLFAYWHRDFEVYEGGVDIGKYFSMVVVNTMSRLVGSLIRSLTILLGILVEAIIGLFGAVTFVLWFSLPFIFFFAFYNEPVISFSFPHVFIQLPDIMSFFRHGVL